MGRSSCHANRLKHCYVQKTASMIAWVQYLSYLIAGLLYYVMLAAFFTVATGFTIWAIVLVFLALVLGGYASGLSFVAPRAAGIFGGVVALIFLLYIVALVFSETEGVGSVLLAVPAGVAVVVSFLSLRQQRESLWVQSSTTAAKAGLGALIVVPAVLSTWLFLYMISNLLS